MTLCSLRVRVRVAADALASRLAAREVGASVSLLLSLLFSSSEKYSICLVESLKRTRDCGTSDDELTSTTDGDARTSSGGGGGVAARRLGCIAAGGGGLGLRCLFRLLCLRCLSVEVWVGRALPPPTAAGHFLLASSMASFNIFIRRWNSGIVPPSSQMCCSS